MSTAEASNTDERFLRGEVDDLPPFGPIKPVLHADPGHFPWYDLGDEGARVIRFAHCFGSYDWSHDPDRGKLQSLLLKAGAGAPTELLTEPFDSLWRTLFALVRADRFSEGTIATNAVAAVRIANEIRNRLRFERSGGESRPPDALIEPYVARRIRKPPPSDCGLVLDSTPIVAFGEPATARCASLGLNPSRVEFSVDRKLLSGSERRLATFASLGVTSLVDGSDEDVARIVGACRRYFWRRPYRRWFDQLEAVLRRVGCSYYDGTACHLDLAQWATDPTWARLDKSQQERLLDDGVPFLMEQLEHTKLETVFLNGAEASRLAATTLGIRLEPVPGTPETSTTKFSVGKLSGRIRVVGWSTNLQSSWGVTTAVRQAIGMRAAELAGAAK